MMHSSSILSSTSLLVTDSSAHKRDLDMSKEQSKTLDFLLESELRADLISLFRNNPGIIDTIEGIARRIGVNPEDAKKDIDALIEIGMLSVMKLGKNDVIFLDRRKDQEIQEEIGKYFAKLKPTIRFDQDKKEG